MGTNPDNGEERRQPPPKPYLPTYQTGTNDYEDEGAADLQEASDAIEELDERRTTMEGRGGDRGWGEDEEDR